ncbi:UDP-N-acetylmuramoyl-L-alanyl-D-glutamate--2,6-diaminopimelate ligase [Vibrio cortegadensis]|uniref:UDP-N-acetylmuramoyl-L-alanyl-D-glutamate--2,6-diaminopimelate ligase n=1 Tax=Vibrio cortegadensis TaxID=1328770 RepID=A0ABV4M619_9VIBR
MSYSMSLTSLISPWVDVSKTTANEVIVTHLELDSRKVQSGDTFVAIIGHAVDGRQYIEKAIAQGANLVLAQADEQHPHASIETQSEVMVVYIDSLNAHLSQLAGRLYSASTSSLIGVTGTNGKTTITQLITQWLELLSVKSAVMGTTGNGFLDDLQPAANTTGNAIEIQHTLSQLAAQGAKYTSLEISSHGLVQGRVKALGFSAGVFTNLSRDHLDYHGTMQEYAKAKLSLFTHHQCQNAIINVDDSVGAEWIESVPNAIAVSLKSPCSSRPSIWATHIEYAESGITIDFDGHWGEGRLHAPLIGEFNACNVMLALATLLSLGFDKQHLLQTAADLKPVLGRMELFQTQNRAKLVVDYAHTPDALEKALSALRVHCNGQLWAIFGCGGDRDTGKRPMMAAIAEKLADKAILTDDNPRSEDPGLIVQDMLGGLEKPDLAIVEHDRFKAAEYAFTHAGENDIILLAGKGHEDYQVLAHDTVHYSDRETAQSLLGLAL